MRIRNVIALICARGGSKGLPQKNLRLLNGKPLVAWAIEIARLVPKVTRVIVSTDDHEIAEVAKTYGAEVPFMRPPELARDSSPEWLVWQHTIRFLNSSSNGNYSLLVVPPTAPLRSVTDVEKCVEELLQPNTDAVITVTPARRNPYFNMVMVDNGFASLVIRPEGRFYRRQDTPTVYDMTTVAFAVDPNFVLSHEGIFEGRVRRVVIPAERAIDIDDELDLMLASLLVARLKGGTGTEEDQ